MSKSITDPLIRLPMRFLEDCQKVELRSLVSEARPFVELLSRHPLTATWAREWLGRVKKLFEEEAPR